MQRQSYGPNRHLFESGTKLITIKLLLLLSHLHRVGCRPTERNDCSFVWINGVIRHALEVNYFACINPRNAQLFWKFGIFKSSNCTRYWFSGFWSARRLIIFQTECYCGIFLSRHIRLCKMRLKYSSRVIPLLTDCLGGKLRSWTRHGTLESRLATLCGLTLHSPCWKDFTERVLLPLCIGALWRYNHKVMQDSHQQRDDVKCWARKLICWMIDRPAILQKGSNNDIIIVFEIITPTFKIKCCRQSAFCSLKIVLGSCSRGVSKSN